MAITKAKVAALVQLTISVAVLGADKKTPLFDKVTKTPILKDQKVDIKAADVLDFKVRGNSLTVVTIAGKKLTAELTDKQLAGLDPEQEVADKAEAERIAAENSGEGNDSKATK
jgi:hypothetical protein